MEGSRDAYRESRSKKSKDDVGLSVTFDEHVKEIEVDHDADATSKLRPDCLSIAEMTVVEKKYYAQRAPEEAAKTACFGVKSYLHHFYDAKVETQVEMPEDFTEEDDFAYLVDLEKKQRTRSYWYCLSLWVGANLVLIGLIAVLVGLMTPRREEVVAFNDDLKMLDRWAIKFNERLDFCLKVGLIIFGVGNTAVFVTFMLMVCDNNSGCLKKTTDYSPTSPTSPSTDADGKYPTSSHGDGGAGKIPLTAEIASVQPAGENVVVAAEKRFGSRAMQTPYY